MYIELKHEIQVAHRLYNLPGKCQQIHGHSMKVRMRVFGKVGAEGIMLNRVGHPFEFGEMKKAFRTYLDGAYDHKLLLNRVDPWAGPIIVVEGNRQHGTLDGDIMYKATEGGDQQFLPGLVPCEGDPTTENIAKWIGTWAAAFFEVKVQIFIQETSTNGVGCTVELDPHSAKVVVD